MNQFNRIMETWRAWRRWSAVDRGAGSGTAESRVDRALRDGAPRDEGAELGGAMRGRVMNRILSESVDGVSVGSAGAVDVVRDRIGWVLGGCALACVVLVAGVVALRATRPVAAPSGPVTMQQQNGGSASDRVGEERGGDLRLANLDLPVQRLIRSVSGEPLEEEARRLMSDVRRAAAAFQERMPRLSFAEGSRGGGAGDRQGL